MAPRGRPPVSHHVRPPRRPRQVTQRRQIRTPAAEGDRGARVPASARTRGGPAPPVLWLPLIGSQSVGGAEPGTLLAPTHSHSTSREGRGPLREGHDCRLFQGRSGAILSSPPPPISSLLFLLQSCVYNIINTVATNRPPYTQIGFTPLAVEGFRSCRPWSHLSITSQWQFPLV